MAEFPEEGRRRPAKNIKVFAASVLKRLRSDICLNYLFYFVLFTHFLANPHSRYSQVHECVISEFKYLVYVAVTPTQKRCL